MNAQGALATIHRAVPTLSSIGGLGPTAASAAGAAKTARKAGQTYYNPRRGAVGPGDAARGCRPAGPVNQWKRRDGAGQAPAQPLNAGRAAMDGCKRIPRRSLTGRCCGKDSSDSHVFGARVWLGGGGQGSLGFAVEAEASSSPDSPKTRLSERRGLKLGTSPACARKAVSLATCPRLANGRRTTGLRWLIKEPVGVVARVLL